MDGNPRSPISDFKPQCENVNPLVGVYRGLLSIAHLTLMD